MSLGQLRPFIGDELRFSELSVENLRFLTTEQALADLDNFIKGFSANYTNPKWVLFGGSYPGTMAALSRQLYPDSTIGAIASSAPLNPVVDYWRRLLTG